MTMFARMATVAASASRVPRWLPPVCLGLIGALLAGGVLSGGALRLGNTPLGARVTGIVTGMMKGTAARAPLAGPAPRRSSRALAVGLPQGCDPNTVNANTQLGGNNGNGLGDTRFFTYDAQPLDDRANLKLNVANGNLVLHLDLLHIKGTLLDEDVALFFNSQAVATVSEVGHGFVLSPGADVKLIITGGGSSVTFVAPSSYQTTYSGLSNGVYQDQPGLDATLISNNNGASYALNFHKTGECFAFNSSGQLTSDTEKNGHQLAFAYNGSGQLSSITDTQNRVTTFTYNGSLLSTITDPIGRTISFRYTTPPCPIQCPPATYLGSVTDAAGAKTSFGYDTSDRLSSVIDPRGNTTTIAYTSSSSLYVRTLTDPTGAATSLYYSVGGGSNPACPSSPAGLVENQLVDANTHATYYCYLPATDQVSAAFDALGHERQSSYTPDYNVATLIDPLTNLSTFTWSADGKNNLAGVSDATGAVTTFGYGTGNLYLPTRTTDPQGMVLAYTYDHPAT